MSNQQRGFTIESLSSAFIQRIRDEIRDGYSVSPFLGSGISSASGILMGQAFDNFLAHTTTRVLRQQWDIRSQGWPALPSQTEHEQNRKYIDDQYKDVCDKVGVEINYDKSGQITGFSELNELRPLVPKVVSATPEVFAKDRQRVVTAQQRNQLDSVFFPASNPNLSRTSPLYVMESGIRHLFDWRATLEFLATATVRKSAVDGQRQLTMGDFDSSVIDSFNRHITEGRKPNLCHKMLAHLARPLRSRVFFTTNFDNLLEQALTAIGIVPQVLDVRTGGEIPPAFTIKAKTTVLKLHGSLVETRADFSCDSPPTDSDRQRFAAAVLGYPNEHGMRAHFSVQKAHIPSHLLVVGYSGSDRRCVLLLKYLLDTDPEFKLFWICFNQSDIDKLDDLFFEDEYRERIIVIKTRRPDLLLYELYQELTFCLPAGGFAYEFIHKIPPRPLIDIRDDHQYRPTESQQQIAKLLIKQLKKGPSKRPRMPGGKMSATPVNPAEPRVMPWFRTKQFRREVVARKLGVQGHAESEGHYRIYPLPRSRLDNDKYKTTSTHVFEIDTNAIKVASIAFEHLQDQQKTCIWLEMQDHPGPRYLVDDLFRTLALWRGYHQRENLRYSVPFEKLDENGKPTGDLCELKDILPHYQNLVQYMGYGLKDEQGRCHTDIVVFLYGRSVPGGCAAWGKNNWQDHQYRQLRLFFGLMSRCGIRCLYMPFTWGRHQRELAKKENYLEGLRAELMGQLDLHQMTERELFEVKNKKKFPSELSAQSRERFSVFEKNHRVFEQIEGQFMHVGLGALSDSIDKVNAYTFKPKSSRQHSFYHSTNALINNYFAAPPEDEGEGEGSIRGEEIGQKFQFLFALSLFRQSRHVSSFLTEAVYNCPRPLASQRNLASVSQYDDNKRAFHRVSIIPKGVLAVDNDLVRKVMSDKWIQILNKHDAFLYKTGSYVWKYRDARLALHDLLGDKYGLILDKHDDENKQRRLEFPSQLRSRTHLWIATWYREAFFATGHANPLIEAIHHFIQALVYSLVAKPTRLKIHIHESEVAVYRKMLARTACYELRKLVRLGVPWIPLWMNVHDADPFFGHEKGVRNQIRQLLGDVKLLREFDPSLIDFLVGEIEMVRHDVELIDQLLMDRGNNYGLLTGISPHSLNAVRYRVEPAREQDNNLRRTWSKAEHLASTDIEDEFLFWEPWIEEARAKCKQHWQTFEPVLNRLVIGLNSHHAKHVQLEPWSAESPASGQADRTAAEMESGLEDYRTELDDNVRRIRRELAGLCIELDGETCTADPDQPDPPPNCWPLSLCLSEMLGEAGYAMFKRAKLEVFALSIPNLDTGKDVDLNRETSAAWNRLPIRARLVQATTLLHLALRLIRLVPPDHLGLEVEMRIKFESIYGLALAYLNRFFESHRHLNQAMALLSKSAGGLGGLHLAAIRLRRAEVFLVMARRQRVDLYKALDGKKVNRQKISRLARQFFATFDDAVISLDYAEEILSGVAHSNLWWGRYRSLMLMAYGILPNASRQEQLQEHAYEPLLFRRRQEHDTTVRKLFQRLQNTTAFQCYRRIRSIDYYLRAIRERLGDSDFTVRRNDLDLAKQSIKKMENDQQPGPLEQDYLENVRKLLDATIQQFKQQSRLHDTNIRN